MKRPYLPPEFRRLSMVGSLLFVFYGAALAAVPAWLSYLSARFAYSAPVAPDDHEADPMRSPSPPRPTHINTRLLHRQEKTDE